MHVVKSRIAQLVSFHHIISMAHTTSFNFFFADRTTMMQADDPEYQKVFATLEELDLGSLKPVFKEKRFRVTSHITRTRVVDIEFSSIRSCFLLTFWILDE